MLVTSKISSLQLYKTTVRLASTALQGGKTAWKFGQTPVDFSSLRKVGTFVGERVGEIGQTSVNRSSLNKAGTFVRRRIMTPAIAVCVISSPALLSSCAGETRKQIPCPEKESALKICYEK